MDYTAAGVGHFQSAVLMKVDPVRKFGFCTKKGTILIKIWASKKEISLNGLLKAVCCYAKEQLISFYQPK